MANPTPILPLIILALSIFLTTYPIPGLSNPTPRINAIPSEIPSLNISNITTHPSSIRAASNDYGNLVHKPPLAVLYPSSINDVVALVKHSHDSSAPFPIAARGHGHSIRGQAMAPGGVVVDMASLRKINNNINGSGIRVSWSTSLGYYADVGGEQLWIDVLRAGLERGLAPVSWTDYLYLSVGGTLSNGGISGQAFLHGPQICNVLELDVITGKGEFITCSRDKNSELFFGVLGGLGQFGIITRARIVLNEAPTRAKWARLMYSNFSEFTRDQEHLISLTSPSYVEGFLITNVSAIDEWRSSFSSPSSQSDIVFAWKNKSILYSIELLKYYHNHSSNTIDNEFEAILEELNFIRGLIFSRDVPLIDFLNRVGNSGDDGEFGGSEIHPWLNLFVPRSGIQGFNDGVIVPYLKHTTGLYLFYPLNTNKWDSRMSGVTPNEDVFYNVALLHSGNVNELQRFEKLNDEILKICEEAGIEVKEYLPHFKSRQDWIRQFGSKWRVFQQRKMLFDPKMILSPGQGIFN